MGWRQKAEAEEADATTRVPWGERCAAHTYDGKQGLGMHTSTRATRGGGGGYREHRSLYESSGRDLGVVLRGGGGLRTHMLVLVLPVPQSVQI